MQGFRGIRTAALIAVASAFATGASAAAASAGQRSSTLRTVSGTVSCATSAGALQINAYAYSPSVGYAGAFVTTGPENTAAAFALLGAETDKSNYSLDKGCSRAKKSVGLTHHGLSSAGVVKAGYNQWLIAYCGAPGHVFIRYRIGLAGSGRPATATIVVWANRKKSLRLRQIGYVQWSRSRSTTYYSKQACVAQY